MLHALSLLLFLAFSIVIMN